MNNKELQKKFEQQANIKNSEFDRLNTNATRQSNPVGKGQNFLPTNFFKAGNDNSILYILKYVISSIILFFLLNFFGKFLLPTNIYAGTYFFIGVLFISVCAPRFLYRK